jgi:hypothetical protein
MFVHLDVVIVPWSDVFVEEDSIGCWYARVAGVAQLVEWPDYDL